MKTTDLLGENISLVTPTKVTEPDHEVQMARSDLYKAGKYAIDLHNMLKTVGEAHGLEGWVQAKITKAADYLESVYHYLDYEMKSRGAMAEGAPTGPSGPIPPGAVPVGGAVGPSVAPAQAAAMAAKGRIDQKKAIESKIKDLEMQKQQLQRQLAQAGQVQETTSAGAIASSMGGNGLGKSKTEVGSLFGGTYKTKKKLKGAPHSNAPRLGVAESANTLFDVTVIDPKTGNEKTMEISALTATEAKSKVAGKTVEVDGEKKHYKVVSVKSAWDDSVDEDITDEAGPASRSLCLSKKSNSQLGASQLASCKSQGLRAREGDKSHKFKDGKRAVVGGKKIKGKAHGGPLPDWGTRGSKK